ncbi:MAG: tetratricopeptide repeat protein [Candidatus Hydrogenedentes bacterium]|nr:tetratricopeptide repeat protein [Candidatus Hydrogenedentota bacterium]
MPTRCSLAGALLRGYLSVVMGSAAVLLQGCATNGASYAQSAPKRGARPDRANAPDASAKTLYALARILIAQEKDGQAEVVLQKVLKEDPTIIRAYSDLAKIQLRRGKPNEAIQTINHGLKARPDDPVLLNNLGVCNLFMGEFETALDSFTKASTHDPREKQYAANQAATLGLLGRHAEAFELYKGILPPAEAQYNATLLQGITTPTSGTSQPVAPSGETMPTAAVAASPSVAPQAEDSPEPTAPPSR